jgi:hypothetical protein
MNEDMFSGENLKRLRGAVISAFPNINDLRLFLSDHLNSNDLDVSVDIQSSYENIVHDLIQFLLSRGTLEEFIREIYRHRSNNRKLREIRSLFISILEPDNLETNGNQGEVECPYRGLEPFTKATSQFFFGRDDDIRELLTRLVDRQEKLIFISGSSGAGKTSLMQAGLIPRLEKERWEILEFIKPGSDPKGRLRYCIEELFRTNKQMNKFTDWYERLTTTNDCNVLDTMGLLNSQNKLLFIDQFEEVFTICQDAENRELFIRNLQIITQIPNLNIYIVINMRTDFSSLLQYIEQPRPYFLSPLNNKGLRAAIINPSNSLSYTFEDGLVESIIEDINRENCLPILQFTLKRLWEEAHRNNWDNIRTTKRFLHQHYQDIGGLTNSLNTHANTIFDNLNDDLERDIAKNLFISLVQTNKEKGGKDTSRKRKRDEILRLETINSSNVPILSRVLMSFIEGRLLIESLDEADNSIIWIDLAHETLIDEWHKFRDWLSNNRESRIFWDLIIDKFKEWRTHLNEEEYEHLLNSSLIKALQSFNREMNTTFNSEIYTRLENLRSRDEEFERFYKDSIDKQEREDRLNRLGLEISAKEVMEKLSSPIPMAELKAMLELVRRFQSGNTLQGCLQNTLRLAMEIAREKNCLEGHTDRVKCVAISHSGELIASGSEDKHLRICNSQGDCIATCTGHSESLWAVAFAPDDSWVISGGTDNTLRRWDLQGNPLGESFQGHTDWIRAIVVTADGQSIYSASKDGTIRQWNLSGQQIRQFPKGHGDWETAFYQ